MDRNTQAALNKIESDKKLKRIEESQRQERERQKHLKAVNLKKRKKNLKRTIKDDLLKGFKKCTFNKIVHEVVSDSIKGKGSERLFESVIPRKQLSEVADVVERHFDYETLQHEHGETPMRRDVINIVEEVSEHMLSKRYKKIEEAKNDEDLKDATKKPVLQSDDEELIGEKIKDVKSQTDIDKIISDRVTELINTEKEEHDKAKEEYIKMKDKIKKTNEVSSLFTSIMIGVNKKYAINEGVEEVSMETAYNESEIILTVIESLNSMDMVEWGFDDLYEMREFYKFKY